MKPREVRPSSNWFGSPSAKVRATRRLRRTKVRVLALRAVKGSPRFPQRPGRFCLAAGRATGRVRQLDGGPGNVFRFASVQSWGANAELNRYIPARVLELGQTTANDYAKTEGPGLCTASDGHRCAVVRSAPAGATEPVAREYNLASSTQTG